MLKLEEIRKFQSDLIKDWGEAGNTVCELAYHVDKFGGSFEKFLTYCTPCGGNWGGLILSGLRELYPKIYEAIPEKMGRNAFCDIIRLLQLLDVEFDGVEFDEEEKGKCLTR